MGVDVEKAEGIINTLRKMSSRELAVTVFLVVSAVAGAFWIENRYAKIQDTQSILERQQQDILQQQRNVENLQKKVINVVNSLPVDVRKEILERSVLEQAIGPDPKKFIPN